VTDKDQDEKQQELRPHTPDLDMPDAEAIDPPSGPGGADAAAEVSDVGEGEHPQGEVLTPDPPLSAQTEDHEVPDEIQEAEGSDETVGDTPDDDAPPEQTG
jgi:hypothetical protein